jgi:hypothetical protein
VREAHASRTPFLPYFLFRPEQLLKKVGKYGLGKKDHARGPRP